MTVPLSLPVVTDGGVLRPATDGDMAMIQRIYAHHVLNGFASFETDPPDLAEMVRRRDAVTAADLPYLVALADDVVKGYAYLTPYRTRPAYRYTVENSVYVAPDAQRRGYGRVMMAELVRIATAKGYRQMMAVIGDKSNAASIEMHRRVGFEIAGEFPGIGFKHGRWVDSLLMQRPLGEGATTLPEPGK